VRLNAYLARAGVASRRKADELIKAGRVTVNGELGQLNTFVAKHDRVELDGQPLARQRLAYVLLHKPAGVVTRHDVAANKRADAPLLIVDIAVPRSVDRSVAELAGLTVLDLDDLRDWADRGIALRSGEVDNVRAIVTAEVEQFSMEVTARQAAPLVAQLHETAEAVRTKEVARFAGRLAELDDDERDTVEALTRAIVAKLLHGPSVRLRHDAGTPKGERNAAAVSDLFDLH